MDGLCEGEKEGTSRADNGSDRFRYAPLSPSGSFSTLFSSSLCRLYRGITGSRSFSATRCILWRSDITLSSHFWAIMVSLVGLAHPTTVIEVLKIGSQLTRATALPFLHHTEFLLSPVVVLVVLWVVSLFGVNLPKHFAPVLWAGADLRKQV